MTAALPQLPPDLQPHLPRMYRVALRIVGEHSAAEDVVQEACAKAIGAASGFAHRSSIATWLHRITTNCAVDLLRRSQRQVARTEPLNADMGGVIESMRGDPAAGPERRELYRLALAMMELLPDDCRSAFVLTQVDGYRYDEAAAIEGQPRGTIASRVHRARAILAEHLASIESKGTSP